MQDLTPDTLTRDTMTPDTQLANRTPIPYHHQGLTAWQIEN